MLIFYLCIKKTSQTHSSTLPITIIKKSSANRVGLKLHSLPCFQGVHSQVPQVPQTLESHAVTWRCEPPFQIWTWVLQESWDRVSLPLVGLTQQQQTNMNVNQSHVRCNSVLHSIFLSEVPGSASKARTCPTWT